MAISGRHVPFESLFRTISPKDFITLFSKELPLTMAFILAFCPRKGYVKKILRLLDEIEKDRETANRTSIHIRKYFARDSTGPVNVSVIEKMEKAVNKMVKDYTASYDYYKQRKKLLFKLPDDIER